MFVRMYAIFRFVTFIMYEFRRARVVHFNTNVFKHNRAGFVSPFGFTCGNDCYAIGSVFFTYCCSYGNVFYFKGRRFLITSLDRSREEVNYLNRFIRANIRRVFCRKFRMIRCRVVRISLLFVEGDFVFMTWVDC